MIGRKHPFVTFLLSLLPGAGHMYLGLTRRGVQLMAAFFGAIGVADALHTGPFLPGLIAIIWFYAMFDALQMTGRINHYLEHGGGAEPFDPAELQADRIIDPLWIGGAALLAGWALLIRAFMPGLWALLWRLDLVSGLVGLVLIGFGAHMVMRHLALARTAAAGGTAPTPTPAPAPDPAPAVAPTAAPQPAPVPAATPAPAAGDAPPVEAGPDTP